MLSAEVDCTGWIEGGGWRRGVDVDCVGGGSVVGGLEGGGWRRGADIDSTAVGGIERSCPDADCAGGG
jgi:hypothetical protein